jgi:hypothetical protein
MRVECQVRPDGGRLSRGFDDERALFDVIAVDSARATPILRDAPSDLEWDSSRTEVSMKGIPMNALRLVTLAACATFTGAVMAQTTAPNPSGTTTSDGTTAAPGTNPANANPGTPGVPNTGAPGAASGSPNDPTAPLTASPSGRMDPPANTTSGPIVPATSGHKRTRNSSSSTSSTTKTTGTTGSANGTSSTKTHKSGSTSANGNMTPGGAATTPPPSTAAPATTAPPQ